MPDQLSAAWLQAVRRKLLRWYRSHHRDLPWRKTRDLYAIWISEIMLQQTQVATVVGYFQRFLQTFPNVRRLAQADERDVLRCWEGLGYYRRARQLHRAAQVIAADFDGRFPDRFDDVVKLPGIGRYTAGAILSIGLDQRHPILEANTVRLYARLLAWRGDPGTAAGQQRLWSFAEQLLPAGRTGDFNQALMELGSTVCTPRDPRCDACPLQPLCPTRSAGLQAQIPQPKKKTAYISRVEAAVVIRHRGRVLLRQCQAGERWAGLWDFPRFQWPSDARADDPLALREQTQQLTGLAIAGTRQLTTMRHGVTRFRIQLRCYEATVTGGRKHRGPLVWVRPDGLHQYPLSVTGRKISRLIVDPSAYS